MLMCVSTIGVLIFWFHSMRLDLIEKWIGWASGYALFIKALLNKDSKLVPLQYNLGVLHLDTSTNRAKTDWAVNLPIPTRFSAETMSCIESGVLTKKARGEIVHSLSILMLVHTNRPSPDDYTIVSRRMIQRYPSLKDKVDNGYVSWNCSYLPVF